LLFRGKPQAEIHKKVDNMTVTVHLFSVLQNIADGQSQIEVTGNTIDQCLENLIVKFPEIKRVLFSLDRSLSGHFSIFVNGESIQQEDMQRMVLSGDDIHIIPSISGG
jgi:MoaD family protein